MYHPQFDPVAFVIGPLPIRWYGLMYLIGICVAAWWLVHIRARRPGSGWNPQELSDLITVCVLGLMVGARLGDRLFYDLAVVSSQPLEILKIRQGGMSFHGGLLGVLVVAWYYARRTERTLPAEE